MAPLARVCRTARLDRGCQVRSRQRWHNQPLVSSKGTRVERILEPEIMDGQAEADAYARADFADSNQWYADHFAAEFPQHLREIVDLGCGPADVTVRVARLAHHAHIVAVDGSSAMLEFAQKAIHSARLSQRIALHLGRLPGLSLPERHFDAVLSKDMLHHLPDPQVLWSEVRRLGKPRAAVFVMDLVRPDSPLEAREIVERVAAKEHPVLKEDFYNSLCAAFTISEVRSQLESAGLPLTVEQATARHMRIKGILGH
jgi:ubiquinone/menaquinone biosynthesis C-methylase UbiE